MFCLTAAEVESSWRYWDLLFLVGSASVIWSREPPDIETTVIGKTLLETVLRIVDRILFSHITLGANNCFCYVFTWLWFRQLFDTAVLACRTKVLLFCRILKKVSFVSQQCDKTAGNVWLCRIKCKTLSPFFFRQLSGIVDICAWKKESKIYAYLVPKQLICLWRALLGMFGLKTIERNGFCLYVEFVLKLRTILLDKPVFQDSRNWGFSNDFCDRE